MGTTNTLDLNNRVDKLEKAVSGGDSAQANKSDIATEFSAATNYTAGCFVYYGGKLYQFNADHSAGAWDPTDVVEANVTDQIVSNKSAIDGLTASDVGYDNTDSGLTATDVQGALDELRQADNVMMSDGTTSVEGAVNEVASGLTNIIHSGNVVSGTNISIPGTDNGNVRMIIVKRANISVAAVVLTEYWSDTVVVVYGTLPAGFTITKSQLSNDIVITNGTGSAIAYLVIN